MLWREMDAGGPLNTDREEKTFHTWSSWVEVGRLVGDMAVHTSTKDFISDDSFSWFFSAGLPSDAMR